MIGFTKFNIAQWRCDLVLPPAGVSIDGYMAPGDPEGQVEVVFFPSSGDGGIVCESCGPEEAGREEDYF